MLLFLFSGCLAKETPTIDDILSNPNLYSGKTVIIEAKFGGWGPFPEYCNFNRSSAITRSDIILYDSTGCMHAYGELEWLSFVPKLNQDEGKDIRVKTIVKIYDGKPHLG